MELLSLRRLANGRTEWEFLRPIATQHLGLRVQQLQGKGFGVLALKPFRRGQRILSETPLVVWESSTAGSSGSHCWSELDALVDELSADERSAFYGLCDKHSGNGAGKTAQGVWNSNSYPTEDILADGRASANDGVVRSACYAINCRINHSCRPNCHHAWNSTLRRQTVHALRDIAVGEEITVAYVGGAELGVRESRRAKLDGGRRPSTRPPLSR